MISARTDRSFAALAEAMTAKARAIAAARSGQERLGGNPQRWRHAALLWPLFGKG